MNSLRQEHNLSVGADIIGTYRIDNQVIKGIDAYQGEQGEEQSQENIEYPVT